MTTLQEATTASSPTMRLVERVSNRLGRFSRRGFLVRTAVVGSAIVVDPRNYVLTPMTASAAVGCGPAASCAAGYTVMCCTINKGVNACPPGTFAAGWWKAADSSWCCGGYRYITDCNASCSKCTSGCSDDNICSSGCWSCSCKCGSKSTCDQRRVCCNAFRYGQCNTHVKCSGGVACRVVSCVAPYKWANCTTTSLSDNATAEHNAPCLQGCSPISRKYDALGSLGSPLGASTGPDRAVGDGIGKYVNYQHGAISWRPENGAHAVFGYAYTVWVAQGRERGSLGYPRGDKVVTSGKWVQYFDKGGIADTASSATALVLGVAYGRWRQLGGYSGVLGYPITNRVVSSDRWIQYFEHGVIADTTSSVTAYLSGTSYTVWKALGGEKSALGFPVKDRVVSSDRWIQYFERGVIADTTSTTTQSVTGAVFTRWKQDGAETGRWGYPVGPATAVDGGGTQQAFEGGVLTV
ncbi:LGFP repeat-containing protein [Angustibacter luteus]|uniref:LGFP repeat-containing protein n=1 Tax=Angustibacter luteus TaxID=658456 RepID=A0ABW1JF16_9ACTN